MMTEEPTPPESSVSSDTEGDTPLRSGRSRNGRRRRRIVWFGALFLAILLLLPVTIIGGIAWRVTQGPVSLKPLLPVIQTWMILPGEGARFSADDIVLNWRGQREGLSLRVSGLRLQLNADQSGFRVDEVDASVGAELVVDGIRSAVGIDVSGLLPVRPEADASREMQRNAFRLRTGPGEIRVGGTRALRRPFQAVELSGHLERVPRRWRVSTAAIDFRNARVIAQASFMPSGRDSQVTGTVRAENTTLEDAISLWPAFIAPGGRSWVAENLQNGTVGNLVLEFSGRLPGGRQVGALVMDRMQGAFDLKGVTAHYFRPLPPIRGINAAARFSENGLRFTITSGAADGFSVKDANVDIYQLDQIPGMIDIDVRAYGPVANAFALLGHPRLDLLSDAGLAAEKVRGTHQTRFVTSFPLIASLRFRDTQTRVDSRLSAFGIRNLFRGQDISRGTLDVAYRDRLVTVQGSAEIEGTPVRFDWRLPFASSGVRHRASGSLTLDNRLIEALGLGWEGLLTAPVPTRFTYVGSKSGPGTITARMDLKPAELNLQMIGWRKPAGQSGRADLTVSLDGQSRVREINSFEVRTADLELLGSLTYAADRESLERLHLKRFALGGNVLAATIVPDGADGLAIEMQGETIDLGPLLVRGEDAGGLSTPLRLRGGIDRLQVGPRFRFANATIEMRRDRRGWDVIKASAAVPESDDRVSVSVRRNENGHDLDIRTDDMGTLLSSLDLNDSMRQGSLVVTARREGPWNRPWKGVIRVRDFRMVGITGLSRLLALISWQGIQDALRGQGVTFDRLDAPFELNNGVMTIRDARAAGSELILTGEGTIDLEGQQIGFDGFIVPARTANELIGKIPLIGRIITGADGGGLVALSYKVSGNLEQPDVGVNPLSIFQLGIIRDIFGHLFGSGGGGVDNGQPEGE